jgi:tRNA (cytidine/uridine-2'-O-)-methyltransferase
MFEIVLFEPEIPPNTGNVIRLCANTGCRLHLVRPLGFSLHDKQLQRAGLDYSELANIVQHEDWPACRSALAGRRLFAVTTRGMQRHHEPQYAAGDVFVFGPETRGLPAAVLAEFAAERRIRLPMREASRSLNLSNAVAVVVYEAWRQLGFPGGA